MARLALFGGTFDPIHCAHIAVAKTARTLFALDEVWLIPASHPPHKANQETAPYDARLRMVEMACAGEPGLLASDLERGEGRNYSIATIERVRADLQPADSLFFLIGADAFAEVMTWHRAEDVLRSVEFIVVSRPGAPLLVPEGARVQWLESLALTVSSSAIRAALAGGDVPRDLPPAVAQYIRARGLYAVAA